MIARGFKSVIWVATVGGAALCCYMVSLKVATERAELTKVERQIVEARRDIRALQTELGTRGRMSQLEQWNADVLALSAPTAAQFLRSEVTLARFEQTEPTLDERSAEVRMASAEAPADAAAPVAPVVQAVAAAQPARPQVRRASFSPETPSVQKAAAQPVPAAAAGKAPAATKTAKAGDAAVKAKPEAAQAKVEPKGAAKAASSAPADKTAKADKAPAKAEPAKGSSKTASTAAAGGGAAKPRASRIDSKLAAEIKSAGKAQGSGGN